jgi:GH24 family phage-related lysozyme (muramidase)
VWPSVAAAFLPFSVKLEGEEPWMYLDILGYVTTAIGNKVDPVGEALGLPWVNADGSASSAAEITAAWNAVDAERSDPKGETQTSGLATRYGGAFGGVTSIRLTPAGIAQVFNAQVLINEATLRRYFPSYDTLPADAQMGIHSMAWAMGAGFPATFTAFTAAVNARDFVTAGKNAGFRGSGVQTRIAADAVMFGNAAAVQAQGLDPSVLYYPGQVGAGAPASSSSGAVAALVGGVLGIAAGVAWRLLGGGA